LNFKDSIKQDLEVFFNLEEFGEEIVYNDTSFPAIFLNKSDYIANDGYIDSTPALLIKTTNAANIYIGDVLYFRNEKFFVLKKEFKDEFVTKIYISKDNRKF